MKKFPIKFKPITNILFIAVAIALCFIVYFNIKKIFDTGFDPRFLWLYIILLIFALILFAFLISAAFFSKYKVDDTNICICLGIFPFKIEIKKIDKIINYEKNSETFILYTKNGKNKTHLIFIEYSKQREFIDHLKNINRNLIYMIENEENNK